MSVDDERLLQEQIAAQPDQPAPWLQLTALLEQSGQVAAAEDWYRRLIARLPQLPVARFNFACFLRRRGRLEEALVEHQQALDLGIDQPEEPLSNMGVIHTELGRDEQARSFLDRALAINPDYLPARYNLALLHEEFGDLPLALKMYAEILELNPAFHDALVRIAHARRAVNSVDPVIRKLRRALRRSNVDPLTRESLHFALGKALDDCGSYDEAFAQYELGNRLGAARLLRYDPQAAEDSVTRTIKLCSPEWLASQPPVSDRPLVFITGLFRSGSTLCEQVLASHPQVTAGGEIDWFNRQLLQPGMRFPAPIDGLGATDWQRLGAGYLEYLDRRFPAGALVTNKRPDAFALLGMLKAMFPNARFINTVRDPRDTCLAIWFQQFDGRLAYANDLELIAHHYRQYRRLMAHWRVVLGASLADFDYDRFVQDPRPQAEALLAFLGLEWHEGCLEFQRSAARVRTASVGQVREPLYRRASGRWRNYEKQLKGLERLL